MNKSLTGVGLTAFSLLALTPTLAKPGMRHQERRQTFRIEGAVEKPDDWTVERISREFAGDMKTISYTLKKKKGKARCLPLLAFVQAAKPRLDAKIKNHQLAFALVVRAADGYTVTYSMAELLPQYGHHRVYLTLTDNGKPLPDSDAPARLIDLDEAKPSRWIHAIRSIQVLDTTALPAN